MAWQDFGILEAQILITVAATIANNMLSRLFMVAVLCVSWQSTGCGRCDAPKLVYIRKLLILFGLPNSWRGNLCDSEDGGLGSGGRVHSARRGGVEGDMPLIKQFRFAS